MGERCIYMYSLVFGTTAADTMTADSLRLQEESLGLESGVAGYGSYGSGAEASNHTHMTASITKQSQGLGK